MNKLRFVAVLCWVLFPGASGLGGSPVFAQETGQPEAGPGIQVETLYAGGTLNYTVMKTENASLDLTPVLANAFAPIALPCPATAGANGCTFRVTVTSQFWNIPAGNLGRMSLTIGGPGTLGPAPLVNVASDTTVFGAQTHSMQWVKKNIPAGSAQTVTVQFNVNAGTGNAGYRTLSIEIYNGLL
jgi:hypothetical protein